jgi:hypothetical protein
VKRNDRWFLSCCIRTCFIVFIDLSTKYCTVWILPPRRSNISNAHFGGFRVFATFTHNSPMTPNEHIKPGDARKTDSTNTKNVPRSYFTKSMGLGVRPLSGM